MFRPVSPEPGVPRLPQHRPVATRTLLNPCLSLPAPHGAQASDNQNDFFMDEKKYSDNIHFNGLDFVLTLSIQTHRKTIQVNSGQGGGGQEF